MAGDAPDNRGAIDGLADDDEPEHMSDGNRHFDKGLPSPLSTLRDLLAPSAESVVGEELSPIQQRMYQPGNLETRLLETVRGGSAPDLVVIAGSAGGGKSAIIRHILKGSAQSFGEAIADATHAEAPGVEQVDRLAKFFLPFTNYSERPGGPTRIIAMNTGMVLKFFKDVSVTGSGERFTFLEQYMKERLRVPAPQRVSYPDWLSESVLVVNLDHRPTAGETGDIFDLVLQRLDPSRADGVLDGAPRCNTCKVIDWCYPRANAQIISSLPTRSILNQAAADVALRRGRNLAPRALWDFAAQLALGGLDVDQEDPCDAVVEIAEHFDYRALVRGLGTGSALDSGLGLSADFVLTDPSLAPSSEVHNLIAAAGLDLHDDASVLRQNLAGDAGSRPAVEAAAIAVREGKTAVTGRELARFAWLGGNVDPRSITPRLFAEALRAQRDLSGGTVPQALLDAIEYIAEGLASGFGVVSGPETYYPIDDGGGVMRKTDVFVRADLVQEGKLWVPEHGDPVVVANRAGAEVVGYRPLTLALQLNTQPDDDAGVQPFDVSLPLWELLGRASEGTVPSSVDKERFLGLRRAMESVGQLAGQDRRLPLLIRRRGSGRKFRIAPYGPDGRTLRTSEVL